MIGVRHGEKLFETLATSEELARSVEASDYFRVPLDARGLDYAVYFEKGQPHGRAVNDYDSGSTDQLNLTEVESLMLTLPEIRNELQSLGRIPQPPSVGVAS